VRLGQKLTGTSVYKALNALAATTTLAIALAVGSASATAQDAGTADSTVTTADPTVRTTVDTMDREPDFNWGWLGLAGLVGLLGLMPRDKGTSVTMRDGAGNVKDTPRR
jgi:hypothetical protein